MQSFGQRLHSFQDAQANGLDPKKIGERERKGQVAEGLLACSRDRGLEAERLVFVDEMGTNTSLAPLYVWSRRGERALAGVPRNWGANVTLLASMSAEGMGPCLTVEGSTTREVSEPFLERVLAP